MERSEPLATGVPPSIASVLEEARALRADVRAAERARLAQQRTQTRQNLISTAILAVLALFVGIALVLAWQGNRTISQTRETNRRIVDCTAPTGTCYQQGQARTQGAVGDIIRASIYTAECARLKPDQSGPAFDTWLETCVAQRFTARHAAPSPTPSPS